MTEWEPMPTYSSIVADALFSNAESWKNFRKQSGGISQDLYEVLKILFTVTQAECLLIVFLTVGFTYSRTIFSRLLISSFRERWRLEGRSADKLPECVWRFLFSTFTWAYCYRVVIYSGQYEFFQKPSTIWNDWSPEITVPSDIHFMYILQTAHYLHSIYAVLYQDTWRNDSHLIVVHHVFAVILIRFSYFLRYHNVGMLLILLSDFCDIHLEFAKINSYLKRGRDGKKAFHAVLANIWFGVSMITWFVCRLYLLPLKVLYATNSVAIEKKIFPEYMWFLNLILWMMFFMNSFWFSQFIRVLWNVLTGQMEEIEDIRETDSEGNRGSRETNIRMYDDAADDRKSKNV